VPMTAQLPEHVGSVSWTPGAWLGATAARTAASGQVGASAGPVAVVGAGVGVDVDVDAAADEPAAEADAGADVDGAAAGSSPDEHPASSAATGAARATAVQDRRDGRVGAVQVIMSPSRRWVEPVSRRCGRCGTRSGPRRSRRAPDRRVAGRPPGAVDEPGELGASTPIRAARRRGGPLLGAAHVRGG